jgi:hypothetical protein
MPKENSTTKFYVYMLIDPVTTIPFYIGKGSGDRYKKHVSKVNYDTNRHKANKIKQILRSGAQPEYKFPGVNLTENEAFALEIELIAFYGRADLGLGPLTNLTDGGDGVAGRSGALSSRYGISHTASAKERIATSSKLRGRPIYQIDSNGIVINEWRSIGDLTEVLDVGIGNVTVAAADGCHRTCGGYFWRYTTSKEVQNGQLLTIAQYQERNAKSANSRQVIQKTLEGEIVKIWESIQEVQEHIGKKYGAVWKTIKENRPMDGFLWCYAA